MPLPARTSGRARPFRFGGRAVPGQQAGWGLSGAVKNEGCPAEAWRSRDRRRPGPQALLPGLGPPVDNAARIATGILSQGRPMETHVSYSNDL